MVSALGLGPSSAVPAQRIIWTSDLWRKRFLCSSTAVICSSSPSRCPKNSKAWRNKSITASIASRLGWCTSCCSAVCVFRFAR
eukprot:scaffold1006_cov270-Pinguiococcus_pyrenoidosus.AAC.25